MTIIVAVLVTMLLSYVMLSVYEWKWNKNLDVSIQFEQDHVNEGESGTIKEVVVNEKRLPLLSLLIKFPIDRSIEYSNTENTKITDMQYRNDCIVVHPFERVTRTFQVMFTKRGYYRIEEKELVAVEFFYRTSFVEMRKNDSGIYVYPSRTKVRQIEASFERMMGEYVSKTFVYEDPFEFQGIRAYEPTDPMKKINWGISAKTGELMVNQFYDTNHCSVTIFLLTMENEGMGYYEDLAEEAIRMVRTYLEVLLRKGIPVKVVTNASDMETKKRIEVKEGAGMAHMEYCLKQLAKIDAKSSACEFTELFKQQGKSSNGLSLLVSVSQSDALKAAFEQYLGKQGVGQWMIPVHSHLERNASSRRVQIIYGEVE
ncbi:MAG: DUF58 domain-containing protein [bacterium]|nr:DUF58 domain-containing protein [bacterium]